MYETYPEVASVWKKKELHTNEPQLGRAERFFDVLREAEAPPKLDNRSLFAAEHSASFFFLEYHRPIVYSDHISIFLFGSLSGKEES